MAETHHRVPLKASGPWFGRIVVLFGLLALVASGSAVAQDPPPTPLAPSEGENGPMRPAISEPLPPRTGDLPPPMDLSHIIARMPKGSEKAVLPPSFDWRTQGKVTPVKDQGGCQACYTFAFAGSLESKLLIDGAGTFNLSENHAKECTWKALNNYEYPPGYPWGNCDGGGNALMLANLYSQSGTVLESCDPYVQSDVACKTSCPYKQTVLDWRYISGNSIPDPEVLKQYLYTYGPIITSMYADKPKGFNSSYDGSYTINYVSSPGVTNHAVLIVGWSTSLPPVQGSSKLATGWIVKNQWGTGWGDGGYFYATYGAANLGDWASYVADWQNYETNGRLWYYDEDGWSTAFGWGGAYTTAWGLAKFVADRNSQVTRVEFWTTDATTDIDVYLYDSFDGSTPSNLLAQKLNLSYAESGYHSVLLDSPVNLNSGNDVVAVVKFTNASYGWPIAVDNNGPHETGRTYANLSGSPGSWIDLGAKFNEDVGIRLRTRSGGSTAPALTAITPNHAPNTGIVHISDLAGANFRSGATVKLTRSGKPTIQATKVSVVSANHITCDLNLKGVALGTWNVVVTNPGGQVATLPNGFTVKQSGGKSVIRLPFVIKRWPHLQTLYPVADAAVLQGYPSHNYGSTWDMWAGYDDCWDPDGGIARSLVKFNTTALPSGASIIKARLYLYLTNSCSLPNGAPIIATYRTTGSWSEGSVSWNTRPGFGSAYGSAAVPSRSWGWYTFDVTGLVRGWANGSFPNYGLMVRGPESAGNSSARLGFLTREYTKYGGAYRPRLEVTYRGTAAAITPAPELDHTGASDMAARLVAQSATCTTSKAASDPFQHMDAPAFVP